ncbi:MAG TPA: hypothetical protein VFF06_18820 [Polyangia bacterium]|nr:hypothetical protein [Polyangia bacterium]
MLSQRLVLIVGVVLIAGVAQGKAPSKKEAQRHYDAGIAHYKAQEYAEAADEFEAAYKLKAEPSWLYNLAQACRLAHQNEKALGYYKQYLAEVPDAENRPAVEQRIADVEKALAAEHAAARASAPPPAAAPPASSPVPPAAMEPVPPAPPPSADLPRTPYQLGARIRGIFVTNAMLMPYLQAATSMESWSLGFEFIYRRPKFDVVTSLDISSIDVHDGNWLANDHMADADTHFLQFRGVYFISVDVSLIGHWSINKWLELRYGGGLGVGGVTGDVLTTNGSSACSISNVNNVSACNPFNPPVTGAALEPKLKSTEGPSTDSADNPHRHVSKDKPPAMGVVNILVGLRVKLPKKFAAQFEIGFRDAIFFGLGAHYLF